MEKPILHPTLTAPNIRSHWIQSGINIKPVPGGICDQVRAPGRITPTAFSLSLIISFLLTLLLITNAQPPKYRKLLELASYHCTILLHPSIAPALVCPIHGHGVHEGYVMASVSTVTNKLNPALSWRLLQSSSSSSLRRAWLLMVRSRLHWLLLLASNLTTYPAPTAGGSSALPGLQVLSALGAPDNHQTHLSRLGVG